NKTMHTELSIENFKCFSNKTTIKLGEINICLGSNSVGKSSAIQSCILLRQIYEQSKIYKNTNVDEYIIRLNDIYGLQLGDSQHIQSANKDEITFGIDGYEFQLYPILDSPMEMKVKNNYDIEKIFGNRGLFADEFYYLNAERIGPRNYQLIDSKAINNCGVYGENTMHLLKLVNNNKVVENKCFKLSEDKKVNTVGKQVEYWMDYIIPGIEITTDDVTDLRVSKMMLQQTVLDTGFLSPYNFGFGISYVLPIILTGLIAKEDTVFLVENPEAHLHPKGQSHIGYFLAMMAMAGVQIFIETHSEHVINGIRIAALQKHMNPEEISINYFSIKDYDGIARHVVDHITLNERMDLEVWPEGFMDQEEEDLRTLRELRRK
ncbi:MAG: AAA family ATPase, partial [Eubacterium sp.]|nr:AAA family ATPase [Eubacterium sp.]